MDLATIIGVVAGLAIVFLVQIVEGGSATYSTISQRPETTRPAVPGTCAS